MRWLNKLLCAIFGHKKPYIEKLTATLCRRCRVVLEEHPQMKVSATHSTQAKIVDLKRKSERRRKRGY